MQTPLHRYRFVLILLVFILVQVGCSLPYQSVGPFGPQGPVTGHLLERTSADEWAGWIGRLSGAEPVVVSGQTVTISTRASAAMFDGQENALAFEYLLETVSAWVRPNQIEVDLYPPGPGGETGDWKNLIVTFPGTTHPEEVVVLSAHYDSTASDGDKLLAAPGANDNGTGTAALLEAVRLLRHYRFERTIRVIFFSGEENGLLGSEAYLEDHPYDDIVAVINLDMFGSDSDGDRCFELHVGTLPGSDAIGQALVSAIESRSLSLRYDYLTSQATARSDHASFWAKGVPAILVIENMFDNDLPDGCRGSDLNPFYHLQTDTLENIDLDFGFDIMQAVFTAIIELARPAPALFPLQ